ncbi:MAG: hypothetical protein QOD60_63 [Solirubrobacterales bacterium]|nr:hypothetical protein [Solirubrobacterales bacterium]
MGLLQKIGVTRGLIAIAAIVGGLCASPASAVTMTLTSNATPTAPLGSSIADAATLSGANPIGDGTGVMSFNAYGPNDPSCTAPVFHNQVDAPGDGTYSPSPPFTPTSVGTYYWTLNWSGDDVNPAIAEPCNPLNPAQTSIMTPALALPPPATSTAPPCAGLTGKARKKCLCKQKKGKARKRCLKRLKGRKPA